MPVLVRTYGRTRRGAFAVRLFRLTPRRRPLSARNRRLRARANRLRNRTLERANRRVLAIFASVVDGAERELRNNVPVKTGLLKRRVDARGLAIGNARTVALYSDAMNNRGREYAKYVDGYERALTRALRKSEASIRSSRFRFNEYRISFVYGFVRRSVRIARASTFMSVHREETRIVFTLRAPKAQPVITDTVTVSLL